MATEKPTRARGRVRKPAAKKKPAARSKQPAAKTQATPRRRAPKNLSLFERLEIGEALAVERAKQRPKSWEALSKEHGKPVTTLRDIHRVYTRDMETQLDTSGRKMLEQALSLYTLTIRHMSDVTVNAEHEAVRVGAARVMMDSIRGQIRLMAAMDRMPRSFRAQQELAALANAIQQIIGIVQRRELGPEIVREFMDVLEEAQPVVEGRSRQLPAGEPIAA